MPSLRSILRRRDSPWVVTPCGGGARPAAPLSDTGRCPRILDLARRDGLRSHGAQSVDLAPRGDAPACRLVRWVGPLEANGLTPSLLGTKKTPPERRSGAFSQAAEGTRTLDLLHGKQTL